MASTSMRRSIVGPFMVNSSTMWGQPSEIVERRVRPNRFVQKKTFLTFESFKCCHAKTIALETATKARRGKMKKRSWLVMLVTATMLVSAGLALAQDRDDDDDEEADFSAPVRTEMQMDAAPMRMRAAPSAGGVGAAGTASVTAGGAQDIRYARQLIEQGGIPPENGLIAEGILSEHDLPVDGPPCDRTFCPLLESGYAPSFDSDRGEIWVQLGFNSNIDLSTFERKSLNVAIVLDRSGSMGGEKMEVVRAAALALLADLGPRDRLALVSYASTPEVDLPSTVVDDHDVFEGHIRGWATGGSTNLEGALQLGYQEVGRHAGDADYENRVIVFTDMLPNVGITSAGSFREMSNRWASEGINLTVIGVGADFGQGLGLALSELRGGNYYFLRDRDEARRTFGEELPFMVTPVAYDVEMTIDTAPGFELTGVYGVPEADESGSISTEIKTLFLSSRGGAILMRFIPSDAVRASWSADTPISHVTLDYLTAAGDEESAEAIATFAMPTFEPTEPTFAQTGPYRAWALVQQSLIMRQAIADYGGGDAELARARLSDLAGTLRAVAEQTGDDSISDEVELVEHLARNMH